MNQQRGQGQQQPQTENQQISEQQNAQQKLNQLMRDVAAKRRDIEAVLPADIKFEKFQACLNMAIRREPRLLECHGPTLIRAAIMSAYDGLLPDGKQAVIVWRAMSYKLPNGQWAKTKRLEASYMPMAFGLRMKIVAAGAARHIKATCVYANDFFEWEEGLNERLVHKPFLADETDIPTGQQDQEQEAAPDPRGPLLAVYSIAILPEGDKVFEVVPRREIMKIKAKATTKDVWEGPFEAEMWRKSALRRHTKALPSAVPIRDAEAEMMFPQYSNLAPDQLAIAGGAAPPRPTRGEFAQLGAPEVELPLDLSGFGGDGVLEEERVERGEPAKKATAPKTRKAAGAGGLDEKAGSGAKADPGGQTDGREQNHAPDPAGPGEGAGGDDAADPALPRPTDPAGWNAWERSVLAEIGKCRSVDVLNKLQTRERQNIDAAPAANTRAIENSFLDKRVDLQENPQ